MRSLRSLAAFLALACADTAAPRVAPTITTHPAAATVNQGASVTMMVTATGSEPLTYQWRRNGVSLSGATAPAYTFTAAAADDQAQYSVVVSNDVGSVTSQTATLTVIVPPQITTQPANQTANAGASASFTVVASGTSPTYQWRRNGTAVSGATSATYTFTAAAADDQAQYSVVVSNAAGSVTSAAATLTVIVPPAITTQPANLTVNAGASATFSVVATGTAPTYQWKRNGTNIAGATSASYTIASAAASDDGAQFTVVVSNAAGNVTSQAATLSVTTPPAITTQPANLTVNAGASATFSVAATGTTPAYQWRRNGTNIAGATSASYTFTAAAADDQAQYSVVVSNAAGSVTSSAATLTVIVPPAITTQPASVTVNPGASATFSVVATGTAPSYQWKRNGTDIAGATSASYTLASAAASDHGAQFTVVVSNAAGTVTSQAATLSVNSPPAITAQPANASVLSGVPATFSVTATGTAVTYQWRRNGVNIPGATSATYTVGVPLAGDAGAAYSVVVANALGTVTSSSATLTVNMATTTLRPTSYANAKAVNQGVVDGPFPAYETTFAFGDFFGNGNRDYFNATLVYDYTRPQSEAVPGQLKFWRWTGSTYEYVASKVDNATGCIHPRKAAVADFNGDQKPDIFVACHGYDAAPFPGEQNVVLLSQASGVYSAKKVGNAGFYHNVAAFDVNNDSKVDVLVTDNFQSKAVFAFINDGAGNFTKRTDLLPIGGGPYFTVEVADVNSDGRPDILTGGHDWEGAPTSVLLNDGSGSFANVQPLTIPAVPNEGVVLDFVVLDADRDGVNEIYVIRTSGGDGTFYKSRTVQKVLWPSRTATVIHSSRPAGQGWNEWVPYAFPVFSAGSYSLTSHRSEYNFSIPIP